MKVTAPRDLPYLRQYLLEGWKPDGAYTRALAGRAHYYNDENELCSPLDDWERRSLTGASLWYVSGDMCDLIAACEDGLPSDTVLEPSLIPTERGLVFFERSLKGLDATIDANIVTVDALVWGPETLPDGKPSCSVSSYRYMDLGLVHTQNEIEAAIESGSISRAEADELAWQEVTKPFWVPLGRADWPLDTRVGYRHHPQVNDAMLASMEEDRRRIATIWLLAQQKNVTDVGEELPDRGERRREQRAGRVAPSVYVVNVRHGVRRAMNAMDELPEESDAPKRHVSVRFFVQPFWRMQPWGPGRAYRRPTLVSPHWRGPEDAPVSIREKVRLLDP